MATSDSPRSSHQSTDGTSRPIACLNCRQRRSYCSKTKPACSRCRDSGLRCTYEEARKVPVNESHLRALQAKAHAYDALMNKTTSSTAGDSRKSEESEEEEEFEDEQPLLEPFNQLSLVKPSSSFKGPGSSDTFLRNLRKLSGLHADDTTLDIHTNFYEPGAIPSRRTAAKIRSRLPPPEIARRLFAAQYTYIGTIFAFTQPTNNFEQLLSEAYRGPPDLLNQEACLRYAKVLIVLAFGQLYSVNQWVNFRGPPGFDYFVDVLNLLPDPHEESSILFVETLALVGYFFQNMNRPSVASMYTSMALRMAIALGLHHEVAGPTNTTLGLGLCQKPLDMDNSGSHASSLDDASREYRRRVWWSVYSLDRILSVKSGNPITIQDQDIGVELPSLIPLETDPWSVTVLRHYTQLSRILGEIHMTIYRKSNSQTPRKSGKSLMESVQGIILTLSKWNRELPDELRFDPAKLSISRESVSTFSHYYQCINMTVRPLLSHIVQKRLERIRGGTDPNGKDRDWKEGLSQSTIKMIEVCIGGAQDVINMMTIAAEKDLVATYGYMDGEHVVSATIVLVMVCVAFPANPVNTTAMNAGLRLLKDMGDRGNSHMAARFSLLSSVVASELAGSLSLGMLSGAPGMGAVMGTGTAIDDNDSTLAPGHSDLSGVTGIPQPFVGSGTAADGEGRGSTATMHTGLGMTPAAFDAGSLTFPAVDNNVLSEPFFDATMDTGMDFTLWEEGFADPAMDAALGFSQWPETGSGEATNLGGL